MAIEELTEMRRRLDRCLQESEKIFGGFVPQVIRGYESLRAEAEDARRASVELADEVSRLRDEVARLERELQDALRDRDAIVAQLRTGVEGIDRLARDLLGQLGRERE